MSRRACELSRVAGFVLVLLARLALADEVLLYLGNEPSPTAAQRESIRDIVGWLDSSTDPADRNLGMAVEADLALFPAFVDLDVGALRRLGPSRAAIVIATNRLAQEGVVLVAPRGGAFERRPLSLGPARDEREASNPLSSRANVARVLSVAMQAFPPASHEFVVVTQSHGDEEYALTPRLGLPTEGLTREGLLARVHGADSVFVERYGTTTQSLLSLLVELRRTAGFTTTLLVLSSCESTIEQLPAEVPRALVAAGGAQLDLGSINFGRVLMTPAPTVAQSLVTTLTPAPFELANPDVLPQRRRWQSLRRVLDVAPWFLPLLAWLAVVLWRTVKKPKAQRT